MFKQQKFHFLFLSLLGLLLLAIYFSTFSSDFLPWDDDYNISMNPIYTRGSWLTFWTDAFYGMYIPLTNSIWGILFDLGHGSSFPFRVFNFSLHFLNVILLGLFLKIFLNKWRIQSQILWALAVALFALHPLQVETVAWISGGRDLLSTTLGLLSLLAFFHFENWKGFALGGLFFVLGLLSKPQIASLPLAIFTLDFLVEPQRWRKTAAQMFVWTLPVLAIVFLTFTEQKNYVNLTVGPWERLLVVLDSFGFYLIKLLWPLGLQVDYGRNPLQLIVHFQDLWGPTAFLLVSLTILGFFSFRKQGRREFLLFLGWMACLLPVSGVIDFAYQEISTTADHYNYFPMIFFSLLILSILARWTQKYSKVLIALVVVCASFWSVLSWQRTQIWQNRFVFFEDMLAGNPNSYSALIGMGGNWAIKKDNSQALIYYEKALVERPFDVAATANVIASLFRLHRYEEVMKHEEFLLNENFRRTLQIRHIAAANMLTTFGSTAFVLNQMDRSVLYFCEAFNANPYSLTIQKALDELLAILKQRGQSRSCPANQTDEGFFKSVVDTLSATKR